MDWQPSIVLRSRKNVIDIIQYSVKILCSSRGRSISFLSLYTSEPFREGGRGTAMVLSVGVLPLEFGAGSRPCFGGRAGTISPTSSNKSSPARINEYVYKTNVLEI